MNSQVISIESVVSANKNIGDVTKLALNSTQLDALKNGMLTATNNYKATHPVVNEAPAVSNVIPEPTFDAAPQVNTFAPETPNVNVEPVVPKVTPTFEQPVAPVVENPASFVDEKVDMTGVVPPVMEQPAINPEVVAPTVTVEEPQPPVVESTITPEVSVTPMVEEAPVSYSFLSSFEDYMKRKQELDIEYQQKVKALDDEFQSKLAAELQAFEDDKKKIINLQAEAREHLKNAQAAEVIANHAFDNARKLA